MNNLISPKNLLIILFILTGLLIASTLPYLLNSSETFTTTISKKPKQNLQIRSIDTVKYSRDIAREKENDLSYDVVIKAQVEDIAKTGATHIALGVPYDEEFIPFLKRWTEQARKNNLKVWFRGNFSGWEQWFGYNKIDRSSHIRLTEEFILKNPDLFENGDIFTPCPECENGGPGDPRQTRDIEGHRRFLIEEYNIAKQTFSKIGKKVLPGFYSMNGDVARLIMDKPTTESLGGVIVIDHYVKTPSQLIEDIKDYAENSGGKVVLGEFGVPIPDINGVMSEEEQAKWLQEAFEGFKNIEDLIGVNYWVSVGGSTEIWSSNGQPKQAVDVIKKYYSIK